MVRTEGPINIAVADGRNKQARIDLDRCGLARVSSVHTKDVVDRGSLLLLFGGLLLGLIVLVRMIVLFTLLTAALATALLFGGGLLAATLATALLLGSRLLAALAIFAAALFLRRGLLAALAVFTAALLFGIGLLLGVRVRKAHRSDGENHHARQQQRPEFHQTNLHSQ